MLWWWWAAAKNSSTMWLRFWDETCEEHYKAFKPTGTLRQPYSTTGFVFIMPWHWHLAQCWAPLKKDAAVPCANADAVPVRKSYLDLKLHQVQVRTVEYAHEGQCTRLSSYGSACNVVHQQNKRQGFGSAASLILKYYTSIIKIHDTRHTWVRHISSRFGRWTCPARCSFAGLASASTKAKVKNNKRAKAAATGLTRWK